MKKGLSVLLIAAALFGFYGGATNLNDVLACKDYFESASGASDDMQRLEDGLNQLKDNEQAYLDGQVALAEGEKTLADGYATLADGEAQYAQGLKDYAAAPGKLADGKEGLKSLKKAIKGINDLKATDGYPKWKKNYENMRNAREQFYAGTSKMADSLTQLAAFLPEASQKAYLAAVNDVAKDDGKQTYDDYNTYIKSTNELAKDIPVIQNVVKEQYEGSSALYSYIKGQSKNVDFAKAVSSKRKELLALGQLIETAKGKAAADQYRAGVNMIADAYDVTYPQTVDAMTEQTCNSKKNPETGADLPDTLLNVQTAKQLVENGLASDLATALEFINNPDSAPDAVKPYIDPTKAAVKNEIKKSVDAQVVEVMNDSTSESGAKLAGGKIQLTEQYAEEGDGGALGMVVGVLKSTNDTLQSDMVNKTLLGGLKEFNEATKKNDEGKNGAKQLLEGQDDSIADGVRQLVSGILGDKTMKQNLIKKLGKAKVASMKKYGTKNSPLYSKKSDFAKFNDKMSKDPDVMQFLKDALPVVKARLAAGEKEYAEGLKSYKEAPAKLADARKQLADGRAQLADGEKQLADGRAQLAQYEDGEQQVRDGLATLVGTQPMGDVQGIADRIGNDTDFDNGDEHLELDEGLSAVQAGKGYASDLTAAVTDEIMSRAIATGLLIGAGVLAVLAALLSFLKKNKGAGVLAVLAAAAGCVGAFMGNAAGMQFSSIAGSTMGATPWVAAGILAAVAAVHAIVHFTAKKEA